MDPDKLTAVQILSISTAEPERLFSGNAVTAYNQMMRLMQRWHPSRCSDRRASKVSHRLFALYEENAERIKAGTWRPRVSVAA